MILGLGLTNWDVGLLHPTEDDADPESYTLNP
jgi:hypothetical protein